jgi:hypothetical protein
LSPAIEVFISDGSENPEAVAQLSGATRSGAGSSSANCLVDNVWSSGKIWSFYPIKHMSCQHWVAGINDSTISALDRWSSSSAITDQFSNDSQSSIEVGFKLKKFPNEF